MIKRILYIVIFTALTIAGANVTVPLGEVPFVLSDFFVLLSGLVLGRKYAPVSVGLYLLLGAIGLPVFADGSGGIEHFAGPTGGYLVGFLCASFVVGMISHSGSHAIWKDLVAVLAGFMTIYTLGVIGLKIQTELSWNEAIHAGFLDFLVPMSIKSTAAVLLALLIRKLKLVNLYQ